MWQIDKEAYFGSFIGLQELMNRGCVECNLKQTMSKFGYLWDFVNILKDIDIVGW